MNKQDYFFNSTFSQIIQWDEFLKIRLGTVGPQNKKQFTQGLKNLSNNSIRNRFLGLKKEFSEKELDYFTEFDGLYHYALGVETLDEKQEGIGVVRLVSSAENSSEAELAITIIDRFQGKGLGTILVYCGALAAIERKVERINYSFLPQNDGIIKLMGKLGPAHLGFQSMDFVQNYILTKDIDVERIKSQLQQSLPSIETFQIKT